MSKSITKADLVDSIAAATELSKKDSGKALDALVAAVQKALVDGSKVTLVGFGTFSVSERKERTGTDPRSKKPIKIAASKAVKFKPGQGLKDAVNAKAE